VNVKKWYLDKQILLSEATPEEKRVAALRMLDIAKAELQNAEDAIRCVRLDSRLGYEPSMEYMADESHIREKIVATRRAMEELAAFL
jgi:hypothetical protein